MRCKDNRFLPKYAILCRKILDKWINNWNGNALVDVLVTLQDDSLLDEMSLPKGSMQLINEDKFFENSVVKYSGMKTHKATGEVREIQFWR